MQLTCLLTYFKPDIVIHKMLMTSFAITLYQPSPCYIFVGIHQIASVYTLYSVTYRP